MLAGSGVHVFGRAGSRLLDELSTCGYTVIYHPRRRRGSDTPFRILQLCRRRGGNPCRFLILLILGSITGDSSIKSFLALKIGLGGEWLDGPSHGYVDEIIAGILLPRFLQLGVGVRDVGVICDCSGTVLQPGQRRGLGAVKPGHRVLGIGVVLPHPVPFVSVLLGKLMVLLGGSLDALGQRDVVSAGGDGVALLVVPAFVVAAVAPMLGDGPHLSSQPGQSFGLCSGGIGGGLYLGSKELGLLGHQLPGFFRIRLDVSGPLG